MKKLALVLLTFAFSLVTYGQKATINVVFTASLDSLNVPLDSIKVTNVTQGGDTTLYGLDTTLVLNFTTGLHDNLSEIQDFLLSQNYPNPFMSRTSFNVSVSGYGQMSITVYDIMGRELTSLSAVCFLGNHTFFYICGKKGFYILSVTFNNKTYSMKMYCLGGNAHQEPEILYSDTESLVSGVKASNSKSGFCFTYGDQLSSIGYYQSMTDMFTFIPMQDSIIEFEFQSPSSCPASFTDTRDNNVYSAVQIGNQCWMAENLAYLPLVSPSSSASNTIPYYYVYGYQGTSVSAAKAEPNYQTYGVLYNWPAIMAGSASSNSVPSGVKGICPSGWHLPSDEEWKILEGAVDSQYGYPDPEWDVSGWRGSDAGGNLKETSTTHWNSPNTGATNNSGFTALPAGSRSYGGSFYDLGYYADFWSSAESSSSYAWGRYLHYSTAEVGRSSSFKEYGFSQRCLKD